MKSGRKFLTLEMGAKLRQIRLEAGITQKELAERMGMGSRSGKASISLLELGKVPDPRISTIYLYLRACGASMQELLNLLALADKFQPDTTPIEQAELPTAVKDRLREVTGKQTEKFQRRIRRPRRGLPQPVAKQKEMVARMGRYRVTLNLIEHAVEQFLVDEGIEDALRPAYLAVARQAVGILWQAAKSEPVEQAQERGDTMRHHVPVNRIPPAIALMLSRKDAVWQQQILDMDLVRRVQGLTFVRFRESAIKKE
jgi:transcriptional regulator with XRE-family HTH domain